MKEENHFTYVLKYRGSGNDEEEILNFNEEAQIKYKRHIENLKFRVKKLERARDKLIESLIHKTDKRVPLHEKGYDMNVGIFVSEDMRISKERSDIEAEIVIAEIRFKALFE